MQGNIFNDILVFTALFFLSRLLIDTLLKQDDVVILDKFVRAYQEVCNTCRLLISLSHAMRSGLKVRHFWVAKLLFLTMIFL